MTTSVSVCWKASPITSISLTSPPWDNITPRGRRAGPEAQHFGDGIAFGNPFALHSRTPHNLWKDLDIEREGMQLTDSFCDALRKVDIDAETYHKGFGQLVKGLQTWAHFSLTNFKIVDGMSLWHEAFKELQ